MRNSLNNFWSYIEYPGYLVIHSNQCAKGVTDYSLVRTRKLGQNTEQQFISCFVYFCGQRGFIQSTPLIMHKHGYSGIISTNSLIILLNNRK